MIIESENQKQVRTVKLSLPEWPVIYLKKLLLCPNLAEEGTMVWMGIDVLIWKHLLTFSLLCVCNTSLERAVVWNFKNTESVIVTFWGPMSSMERCYETCVLYRNSNICPRHSYLLSHESYFKILYFYAKLSYLI